MLKIKNLYPDRSKVLRSLLLLGVGFITITSAPAFASGGLFAEPILTYETGDSTTTYPAPFANSADAGRKQWG